MTLYEFEINGCWINTGDDGFARNEQARSIRNFFAALLSRRRATPAWPSRQRETQVWPPKNVPALSLTVYQ